MLNLAPDHLDWHGSMEAYAADKGRIYEGNQVACVYNVADKATEDLVREADVEEGCRAIGFTLGTPGPSQLGVVEGILVDRAFVENRHKQAQELAEVADVNAAGPAQHRQRPCGGGPRPRLRRARRGRTRRAAGLPPGRAPHRSTSRDVGGVAYIDDSKATNTHAAEASLAAYEPIVWIAGGLAKGATFDELVADVGKAAARRRPDRRRPRPDPAKPWRDTRPRSRSSTSTGPTLGRCSRRSRKRRGSPAPGTRCCMAPACASMDMFANYNERGDAFADAVRELGAESA